MIGLTSLLLLAVLAVLLAAAVAGTVWMVVRAHALQAVGCTVAAFACALAVTGAAVNDHFRLYTSWSDLFGWHQQDVQALPRPHTYALARATAGPWAALAARVALLRSPPPGHGALFWLPMPGAHSHLNRVGLVYLPPQYFDAAYAHVRFPVLELFHGSPGKPSHWITGMQIAQVLDAENRAHRAGPMIAVMPDTNGTLLHSDECVNAVGGHADETYLAVDVPDEITHVLRATSASWGAAGYSTGGFCAVNLLLHHPDRYAAAASWDGNYNAIEDHYTGDLYHGHWEIRNANSPAWEVQQRRFPAGHALLLVAGTADHVEVRQTRIFAAVARAAGAPVNLVLQRGGQHVFGDWLAAEAGSYDWLWRHVATTALDTLWGRADGLAPIGSSPASLWQLQHPLPAPTVTTASTPSATPSPRPPVP